MFLRKKINLFLLCWTLIIVECRSIFNEELNDSWILFQRIHKKSYSTIQEEILRRTIWEENLSIIRQHNLQADMNIHHYYLGMNQFGDLTNEEFRQQMNGYRMDLRTNNTFKNEEIFVPPSDLILPDSVDWRPKGYVTPIKDQGQCGSCWAFSATGSLEGQHFAKTSKLISLSEQNLVDCSREYLNFGCNGGVMEFAFLYIKINGGIDTESSYPYEARDDKCRFDKNNIGANDTGFVQIKLGSESDLQSAIATVGPISVSIDASKSSFQFYKSGVYDEPKCSTYLLDHGVLAVGYGNDNGQDYYIVKNSWGTSWGNQGYIWMSRNKHNQCGIATTASYPRV